MPIIEVHLMEGRTTEQKRALARGITEATVRALGVGPQQVRVMIHQLTPEDFSVGGVTRGESIAAQQAAGEGGKSG